MSHLHKLQAIEAAAMFVLLWIVYAWMRIMQTEEQVGGFASVVDAAKEPKS